SFEKLDSIKLPRYASLLENDTLLLATVWKSLKPTSYRKENSNIYYDSNSMFACYVNENKILKEYLLVELQKDYIVKQLDSIRVGGTSISRIRKIDLLKIFIVVPDIEEQHKKVFSYKNSIIEEQQQQVNELITSYGLDVSDENSFLRHQIAGNLKNVRGAFKFLKQIIETKLANQFDSIYDLKFSETSNHTFSEYLDIIDRDLNSINKSINQSGYKIELADLNVESIDLLKFISSYVKDLNSRKGNGFAIIFEIDEEKLKENAVKKILIRGDKDLLRKMFDNIVENAEKHAFEYSISSKNKIKIELFFDFIDSEVQIDFSNTGKPLPKDYSHEAFIRKGSKTGANAGDGFGGWFMNEVMKKHHGQFGFTDETGPEGIDGEFITTIELTFPIEVKL
ncbi:MAG: hypothetical protein KDC67_06850, partial [Ignavibacteriae bacterium]|nr:hypothetical protein [Ignavibacteriota bacterium]